MRKKGGKALCLASACMTIAVTLSQIDSTDTHAAPPFFKGVRGFFSRLTSSPPSSTSSRITTNSGGGRLNRLFGRRPGSPSQSNSKLSNTNGSNGSLSNTNIITSGGDEAGFYYKETTTTSGLTHKVKVTSTGTTTETFNENGDLVMRSKRENGILVTSWFENGQVKKTETRNGKIYTTYYDSDGNITKITNK